MQDSYFNVVGSAAGWDGFELQSAAERSCCCCCCISINGFFPSGRSEGQPSPLFADTAAAAATLLHYSTHTRECDIALDGHDNDDCAAFCNQKTGDGAACGGLIANPMHLCASTHMTEFMGRSCGECGEEVELK